jgi:hypothetical protein
VQDEGKENEMDLMKAAIQLGRQMAESEARRMLALKTQQARRLRDDLTPEQRGKAERIGRIEFKSAGATRKR